MEKNRETNPVENKSMQTFANDIFVWARAAKGTGHLTDKFHDKFDSAPYLATAQLDSSRPTKCHLQRLKRCVFNWVE